jgi:energy-coupling factor transporter transmembrane protein EcfT
MEINNETFILIGIVIVGLIIIKLLGKFMFRLVGVGIILIVCFVYTYFYTNFFNENPDNAVVQKIEEKIDFLSVIDYQEKHCNCPNMTKRDSITCECIVDPVVKDLKSNLSEEELTELKKDKQKYRKEFIAALKRNQDTIQKKLRERNAIYVWNLMVRDLKKGFTLGENN